MIAALRLASRFLPMALAGVVSFAAGSTVGWWAKGVKDAPVIARAEKATADMEVRFKNWVAEDALEDLKASAQALRESNEQAAILARARTDRDTAETARRASSQALREVSRNVPPSEVSALSPGALAGYVGMCERQPACRAPADSPNPERVPDTAGRSFDVLAGAARAVGFQRSH